MSPKSIKMVDEDWKRAVEAKLVEKYKALVAPDVRGRISEKIGILP